MMMTPGAATTLLGNVAGGARPHLGHDGMTQDALIAVPLGLFNSLINQTGGWIGNQIGYGQHFGGHYGQQFAGPWAGQYGQQFGNPWSGQYGAGIAPFQVLSNGMFR